MAERAFAGIDVPLDSDGWDWGTARPTLVRHLGRRCARFPEVATVLPLRGLELADGQLEMDLAVSAERSFHGMAWRLVDTANHESFFVRPHQSGNPDAVQYTPVTNGLSSWQLYHGPGFWAPVPIPANEWFTVRVAFAGARAAVWVQDLRHPLLVIDQLKLGAHAGGIGILVGGPGLHVARFAYAETVPELPAPTGRPPTMAPGTIRTWLVSEPFPEAEIETAVAADHSWRRLEAEPTGLVNLGLANPVDGDLDTVLARAHLEAPRDEVVPLEIGFSDRAVVYLNGQPLFRGDDTYRSRDYRFLGSIGYWDTVHLPLRRGSNELVVAVSETFGGWGIQGRIPGREDLLRSLR